jgi:hypothetical protein
MKAKAIFSAFLLPQQKFNGTQKFPKTRARQD